MKLHNITHIIGAVPCLLAILFTAGHPDKGIVDLLWPFTALCWCISSWMATHRAEQK